MIKKKVSIIDYKVGNHSSLEKIFRELKCSVQVTNKISILEKSDLIVLPGVGTFPAAMKQINKLELVDFLRDWTKKNKYLLGICLGMHLLCDKSSELTETNGIGIIPGEIVKMKKDSGLLNEALTTLQRCYKAIEEVHTTGMHISTT